MPLLTQFVVVKDAPFELPNKNPHTFSVSSAADLKVSGLVTFMLHNFGEGAPQRFVGSINDKDFYSRVFNGGWYGCVQEVLQPGLLRHGENTIRFCSEFTEESGDYGTAPIISDVVVWWRDNVA